MMKPTPIILIIICLIFLANNIQAQPWNSLLPEDKVKNNSLTLFDYQMAFYNYWDTKNVEDGYCFFNGKKVKAGGYKQFKRWEWYWESRVDPVTGEFPNTSAWEECQKIKKTSQGQRSNSGQWTSLGPSTSPYIYANLGRLNCISFHPTNNNILYVGAASGGIWKSTDGGTTWTPKGDDVDAIGVSDIVVISTTGDDIIYLATGDRDNSATYSVGVLKSIDGGNTWQTTGLVFTAGQQNLIYRLLLDPSNNDILYAATSQGVYKSTDAGGSWNLITSTVFVDMEFKPGVSTIINGSTKYGGKVYRSTDSGLNWAITLSTTGSIIKLAVSPDDSTVVYALVTDSYELLGIYKSTDSGENYSVVYNGNNLLGWGCGGDSGGQAWYDLCIAADPNDVNTVFLGGVNTWKSIDGGTTWNINNHYGGGCGVPAIHADKHDLVFQNNFSVLFECNDGGLNSTSDGGLSWTNLSNGLNISQMYRLGVSQAATQEVITGHQDNGTKIILSSNTWDGILGGDGTECIIDYSNENTQYASYQAGVIFRTNSHWIDYTSIYGNIYGNSPWVTTYVQDPNNSNTIFVCYQDVWKSTDQGGTWSKISSWNSSTLRSIAVAPSNSNYIYTSTLSTVYKTTNGGSTWTQTSSLPGTKTYLSVKYDDPNTLWVSMGGFNSNCVYESTDGGTSWTNISSGLPPIPTNCIIQNRQNVTMVELYAATDLGVYLKLGGADWVPYNNNLPNVVVNELEIYYDDVNYTGSLLKAATYGRGLWESDLYSSPSALSVSFSADETIIVENTEIQFTSTSAGYPTNWEWDFDNDGTIDSYDQNPKYSYQSAGSYTVSLIITNSVDSDTLTLVDYITVLPTGITPQKIELNSGWNIMSFYVVPDTMDLLNILQPLINSNELIKVIDEAGGFIQYIPGIGWMNTIGNMVNTDGYYVKVLNNTSFYASGTTVVLPINIMLYEGWNIMGYPQEQPQDALYVLQQLIDSNELIKVINETGAFIQFIPGIGWMNTIGDFEGNKGYYLKADTNTSITMLAPFPCGDTLYDTRDGKSYNTVLIGTQCWMAENLNVGTRIEAVNNQTDNEIIEKYCYNDIEDSCSVYGGLYQWDEMMHYLTTEGTQGICPDGWHLPTDTEWTTLALFLGGTGVAGGKMKETGTNHWYWPNNWATNSSAFTGLPGGERNSVGSFQLIGTHSMWFTSTEYSTSSSTAWYRGIFHRNRPVERANGLKTEGQSVRCLKD